MTIRKTDFVDFGGGSTVDLCDFVVTNLKSAEDCQEAMVALMEKIISIEYQIELYDAGFHSDGEPFSPERRPNPTWRARANKALKLTKMHRQETQNRAGLLAREQAAYTEREQRREFESIFLEVVRAKLPRHEYAALALAANELMRTPAKMEAAE
jgi:hypothetical protein